MWKKVFLFLLTATILVLKFLPVSAAILYGDINRDGNINSTDLTILKRSLLKNTTIDNTIYADLNCDGEINSTDFTLLKRYLLRKLSEFPANSLRPDAVRVDDLMGASVQTITNRFGQPDRIDLSRYGFDWYIYNNDLTKYLQIGIKDGIKGFINTFKEPHEIYASFPHFKSEYSFEKSNATTIISKFMPDRK